MGGRSFGDMCRCLYFLPRLSPPLPQSISCISLSSIGLSFVLERFMPLDVSLKTASFSAYLELLVTACIANYSAVL
jgi:hypothetical protein